MNRLPPIEYFVENGYITYPQYYEIKEDIRDHPNKKFPDILTEYNIYNEKQIAEKMAGYWDVPFVDMDSICVSGDAVKIMRTNVSLAVAKKFCACIVEIIGRKSIVVTDDPINFEIIDAFRGLTGGPVSMKMGTRSGVLKAIDKVYGISAREAPDNDGGECEEEETEITIEKAARYFNVGLCKVNEVDPPKKLLGSVPYETAVKHCCFPISEHGDTVYFAIDNPAKIETYETLKELIGGKVVFRLAGRKDILRKIDRLYGKDSVE